MNSNLIQNEYKVERFITGTTHPYLGAIPTKGTVPLAETLTGTITTDNVGASDGLTVIGSGTIFLTELSVGDFIYDSDASIRKIRYIFSDTMLELEEKFPSSLSGAALKRPKNHFYKEVLAWSSGTADAEIQESAFASGEKTFFSGSPIVYDASAANAEITFQASK